MTKKDKESTPNPASIPNKDIIQRLNFLYQASVYLTNLSHDVPPTDVPHSGTTSSALSAGNEGKPAQSKTKRSKQSRRRLRTADELARAYVDTMTMIGKRATVKMWV